MKLKANNYDKLNRHIYCNNCNFVCDNDEENNNNKNQKHKYIEANKNKI